MHNILFQTICRTGIFMICAQTIAHFRPNESYEKYLKLLVSVMVLIQLFLPIGAFFAGVDTSSGVGQVNEFWESLEQSLEDAGRQAAQMEAMLEQMTLDEVRRHIEEQTARGGQESQTEVETRTKQGVLGPQELEGAEESRTNNASEGTTLEGIAPVEVPDIDIELAPIESIPKE